MLGKELKNENKFVFVCKYCRAIYTSFPEFFNHKLSQHKYIVGKHKMEHKFDEDALKEEPIELDANNNEAVDLSLVGSNTTKIKFPFNKNLDFGTNVKGIKQSQLSKESSQLSNGQICPELKAGSNYQESGNCSNAPKSQGNQLQISAESTKLYSCDLCPMTSKFKRSIVQHRKNHGTSYKHKCRHCTCTYTNKHNLIGHTIAAHDTTLPGSRITKNKTACSLLAKSVTAKLSVAQRMKCHPQVKPYFSSHKKVRTEMNQITCHLCPRTFIYLKAYKKHVLMSHSDRQWYNMGEPYKRRRMSSFRGQPVLCQHCGTLLPNEAKRSQHLKIYHSKPGSYKCGRCMFKTKEFAELEMHKETRHRASSNIKSIQSPHKMDHVTPQHRETLLQPMVALERLNLKEYDHHSNRPKSSSRKGAKGIIQICRICAEQLPSLRAYQIHFKERHTENKPFVCSECPYICDSPHRLSSHKKIHSRKEGFKCKHCSAWFGFKGHMLNHAKLVHGDDTTDGYISTKEMPVAIACSMCQNKFPRFVDLLTHHRNFHAYDELAYSEKDEPPSYLCYPNLDDSEKSLDLQQRQLDVCSPISDNEIFPELTSEMCLAALTAISRFDIISQF